MLPRFNADQYFAQGGRASVGHTQAAGVPVTIENRKGDTRHRQDSGDSKMAADYGYIDTSRPDHDGMKTDAFVGPHKDSDKVFVVNQQHPRTGKFNEHKVLLGYKDRAHALRDYAHSFSDGLGHKRIHSVVEMGTHELKDWLKKPHTAPLKKAEGGPILPSSDPMGSFTGVEGIDQEGRDPGMYERMADRLAGAGVAVGEPIRQAAQGIGDVPGSIGSYIAETSQKPDPSQRVAEDIRRFGGAFVDQATSSPTEFAKTVGGLLPGIGEAISAYDAKHLYSDLQQAEAEGDTKKADTLRQLYGLAAAGAVPGAGVAARVAGKVAQGVEKAAARELSALGLYSHAAEVAEALPQAKGTPEQMKAMLKGVKQEELAGFDEAFAGKKSVTKDEIAQHFRDQMPVVEETVLGRDQLSLKERHRYYDLDDAAAKDGVNVLSPEQQQEYYALKKRWNQEKPTKFGQYTLPGGENYREVLLKLPFESAPVVDKKGGSYGFVDPTGQRRDYWSQQEAEQAAKSFYRDSGDFKSSHWDDPNVLAHLRMSDRTGPNGEKILHVEEIQSDWGQKGKKEGFDVGITLEQEKRMQELSARVRTLSTAERTELQDLLMNAGYGGVPTAPYVTKTEGWTDLALKRALKEAAEGGYDKLIWTPGAEQAKRYSLSNQVHELHYSPEEGKLYGTQINGGRFEQSVSPDKLSGLIGKETSEKLLSQPLNEKGYWQGHQTLSNQDLQLGGEGMKGYYDKIVPKRLQELIKKHDPEAKIGRETLETRAMTPEQLMNERTIPDQNQVDFHSLTITPKMRESILKGQTAFAEGGEVEAPAPDPVEPEAYAEGGPVTPESARQQVADVAHDIANIAHRDKLDQRHLAYLLKVASGMYMPADRAMQYAQQIMNGDVNGLVQRFRDYQGSIVTFARLNQMMGGKHKFVGGNQMGQHMQRMKGLDSLQRTKEHVEGVMDSDVVKARPVMAKALKKLSKRI